MAEQEIRKTKVLASIVAALFAPVIGILLNRQNSVYFFLDFNFTTWIIILSHVLVTIFGFFILKS